MGALIRFILSAPLAALVTVIIFLGLYNQLSPKPFLYTAYDGDAEKIYLGEMAICDCPPDITFICGLVPSPQRPDVSNPWTNSEKAVKEAPEHAPEAPAFTSDIQAGLEDEPKFCSSELPLMELRPPPYPRSCVEKGVEGRLTVQYDISKEGRTMNIVILETPDDCFVAPVIASIELRRYPPYCLSDGTPTERKGVIETYNFEIAD